MHCGLGRCHRLHGLLNFKHARGAELVTLLDQLQTLRLAVVGLLCELEQILASTKRQPGLSDFGNHRHLCRALSRLRLEVGL